MPSWCGQPMMLSVMITDSTLWLSSSDSNPIWATVRNRCRPRRCAAGFGLYSTHGHIPHRLLLLRGVGNDDYLIFANIEGHQKGTLPAMLPCFRSAQLRTWHGAPASVRLWCPLTAVSVRSIVHAKKGYSITSSGEQ